MTADCVHCQRQNSYRRRALCSQLALIQPCNPNGAACGQQAAPSCRQYHSSVCKIVCRHYLPCRRSQQKESADIIYLANSRRESRHLSPWKQQAAEQRAHPAGRPQLATPQPLRAWLHPCCPGPPCLPPSHPGWAGAGLRAELGAAQAHWQALPHLLYLYCS